MSHKTYWFVEHDLSEESQAISCLGRSNQYTACSSENGEYQGVVLIWLSTLDVSGTIISKEDTNYIFLNLYLYLVLKTIFLLSLIIQLHLTIVAQLMLSHPVVRLLNSWFKHCCLIVQQIMLTLLPDYYTTYDVIFVRLLNS